MVRIVPLKDKVRATSKVYDVFNLSKYTMQNFNLGVMFESDMLVIDVDSNDERSKYYIEWIKNKYPKIIITKTPKVGGYHLFFKVNQRIKRLIGATSLFGWKMDVLSGMNNYISMPDNNPNRKYLTQCNDITDFCLLWGNYDVVIHNEAELLEVCPYINCNVTHKTPLELEEGNRNAGLMEWLGFFCAKGAADGITVETLKEFSGVLAKITGIDKHEIDSTVMSSLAKYTTPVENDIETEDLSNLKFVGADYMELADVLKTFILKKKIFGFDKATGLGFCVISGIRYDKLPMKQLLQKMVLYFGDKIYVAKKSPDGISTGCSRVPSADREAIFTYVMSLIEYNSREDIYKNIPKWDGLPRINDFMKKYFLCNSNPNFLWLFLTSIVGMIHDPANTYCPYYFDFVSKYKGVGKSLLLKKLSHGFYCFMSKGRSVDDIYVNAYSQNALLLIDDECYMTDPDTGVANYDWWKQFVTASVDTFSRKNQQPESHDRSFICCRTCNRVKTGHTTDERRQIIFESVLKQNDCRIADLPDAFFEQLLAEAKTYYEQNGVYKLTEEDKESVRRQQALYFDSEKDCYIDISEYVDWARTKFNSDYHDSLYDSALIVSPALKHGVGVNWRTYREWALHNNKRVVSAVTFWRCIDALSVRTGKCLKPQEYGVFKVGGEPEQYSELVPNDADIPKFDILGEVATTNVVSALFGIDKQDTYQDNKQKMDASSTELGAKRLLDEPNAYEKYNFGGYNIPDLCRYVPELKKFFETYQSSVSAMRPTVVEVSGMGITYGLGGAHYARQECMYNDVIHADVTSMYPSIMLNHNLLSRAVTKPDVFALWVAERIRAKTEGDTEGANNLKLKINSVYGLMKANWSNLYDPYNASSIAVYGQVFITLLAIGLKSAGCTIININTDGIIYTQPTNPDMAKRVCSRWEQLTKLNLTFKHYKSITQSDVNNYKVICDDDTEIRKGAKFKDDKKSIDNPYIDSIMNQNKG